MPQDLTAFNRTAVVVGDLAGLGGAIARALTRNGSRVALAMTTNEPVDFDNDLRCVAVPIDVTSEISVRTFVASIPPPSALIIAHGPRRSESRLDADTDDWRWRWETNVLGMARLAKSLLPALLAATHPTIVVVSPDERPRDQELDGDPDRPHFGTRILHSLIEQEISGTPVRLSRVRHSPPAGALADEEASVSGLWPSDLFPLASPALFDEIGEVVSFVVRGLGSLFLEEVSVRPSFSSLARKQN